jgi:hypothetical protein
VHLIPVLTLAAPFSNLIMVSGLLLKISMWKFIFPYGKSFKIKRFRSSILTSLALNQCGFRIINIYDTLLKVASKDQPLVAGN